MRQLDHLCFQGDREGNTPLHLAAGLGNMQAIDNGLLNAEIWDEGASSDVAEDDSEGGSDGGSEGGSDVEEGSGGEGEGEEEGEEGEEEGGGEKEERGEEESKKPQEGSEEEDGIGPAGGTAVSNMYMCRALLSIL